MYIYIYTERERHVYIYICICRERESERERESKSMQLLGAFGLGMFLRFRDPRRKSRLHPSSSSRGAADRSLKPGPQPSTRGSSVKYQGPLLGL